MAYKLQLSGFWKMIWYFLSLKYMPREMWEETVMQHKDLKDLFKGNVSDILLESRKNVPKVMFYVSPEL